MLMKFFGTSGIRNLCPQEVSPALALSLGSIFAKENSPLIIGSDARRTSHMLKASIAAGASGAGARVIDISLCATPTLAYYCKKLNCRGAMATASHNPPEYNGIKLFEAGKEIEKSEEKKIESLLLKRTQKICLWKNAGAIENHEKKAQDAHLSLLLSSIDKNLILQKKPKIVVDLANMSACALMPKALEAAGCEAVSINSAPGEPFGRDLEPKQETLSALSSRIREVGADFGIAHDGDADRAIIADERGEVLGLDKQLALIVDDILSNAKKGKPGAKENSASGEAGKKNTIVSTVESSLSLREIVESHNALLEITSVGSLNVAKKMREKNALFGGEPCGEYIFKNGAGSPDGLMAGLYFAQLFCQKGKFSSLASKIKAYPIKRAKILCANSKKKKAMAQISKHWPLSPPSRADGLYSQERWGWALVRPSGTENYVRITMEARDGASLGENFSKIEKIVKKACK